MIYNANEAHQNLPNYLPPYLCNIRGVRLTTDHQGEKCVKLQAHSPTTVQGELFKHKVKSTALVSLNRHVTRWHNSR
jgi:hypothetical protein